MKNVSKLFSLLLALAMVLSLAVPALADGTDTHTVTITDKYDGHHYAAYQIFDGDYDPATKILSNIKWGTGFDVTQVESFLVALKNESTFAPSGPNTNPFNALAVVPGQEHKLAEEIAKIMQSWGAMDDARSMKLASILHSYTVNENDKIVYTYLTDVYTESAEGTKTGDNYSYTISGLESGYYLIKDMDDYLDGHYDYYTRLIMQVVGNVDITPKGDVPTIEKKVHYIPGGTFQEAEDAAFGDTVYFKLTGTLPSNFLVYESYTYEFVDTLPKGLDLSDISFGNYKAYAGFEDIRLERLNGEVQLTFAESGDPVDNDANRTKLAVATSANDVTGDTDVLITYVEKGDGSGEKELRIKFLDLRKSLPGLISSDKINIKYAATINKDAVIGNGTESAGSGNINKVYLNFSNNPQGDGNGKTPEADAKVYVFELDVNKVDETGKPLANAEFLMYEKLVDAQDNVTYKYAKFIKNENVYTLDGWITADKAVAGECKDTGTCTVGSTDGNPHAADVNHALDAEGNVIMAADGKPLELTGSMIMTSPGENKKIMIEGVDASTYHLFELNAPLSYNRLEGDVQVVITAGYDDNGWLATLNVKANGTDGTSDTATGTSTITVQNSKGSTLPSTGGIGTTIFYVTGGLMVAAAVVLLVTKKRMSTVA